MGSCQTRTDNQFPGRFTAICNDCGQITHTFLAEGPEDLEKAKHVLCKSVHCAALREKALLCRKETNPHPRPCERLKLNTLYKVFIREWEYSFGAICIKLLFGRLLERVFLRLCIEITVKSLVFFIPFSQLFCIHYIVCTTSETIFSMLARTMIPNLPSAKKISNIALVNSNVGASKAKF